MFRGIFGAYSGAGIGHVWGHIREHEAWGFIQGHNN